MSQLFKRFLGGKVEKLEKEEIQTARSAEQLKALIVGSPCADAHLSQQTPT